MEGELSHKEHKEETSRAEMLTAVETDVRNVLERLLEKEGEISGEDVQTLATAYWSRYLTWHSTANPQTRFPVTEAAKNLIALILDWAMAGTLREFGKKRALIWLRFVEQGYAPSKAMLENFQQQNPLFVPEDYERQLLGVFSEANHSMKESVHTILIDENLPR